MLRNLRERIPGAPNFTYGEFVKSDTAIRLGIDNTPTEQHWKCIEALAINVLQPVREKFGRIRITSGYRSVKLCKAIGSSASSNHARGQAADFEPYSGNVSLVSIIEFIAEELDFRTAILEYPPQGWVHCDYRIGGNSKLVKLKDKTHNYTNVSVEFLKSNYK